MGDRIYSTNLNGVRLSIGLCAWNEELWIESTIESLLKQDVFDPENNRYAYVEVIVLANACSDDTARVAKRAFDRNGAVLKENSQYKLEVVEIEEDGLARAINTITHELADPSADYLVKLDCDVTFGSPNVIDQMVQSLQRNPQARVCRPRMLKHLHRKRRKTLVDRFSLFASRFQSESRWWVDLSGPCYCGVASVLRTIWEPIGLRGTDVYVRDMIVTSNWRHPHDRRDEWVVLAPEVTVYLVAYSDIKSMLYHQTRHQMALVMRRILHEFLSDNVSEESEEDAGQLVRRRNRDNPGWFLELVQSRMRHGHWWVLPTSLYNGKRFRSLRRRGVVKMLVQFVPAMAMEVIDTYCRIRANKIFRNQMEASVWRLDR